MMETQNAFLMFANSLKLIRRAEIEHEGENIIDEIYTDLLPNEGILQQVNLPRTSILKGRKGTGKSTIFQKSIADMKGNKDVITVYIDVKTLFDSATPTLSGTLTTEMSEEIKKYLIYKNFLFEVIKLATEGFKSSIKTQPLFSLIAHSLRGTVAEVEEELSEILDNINEVVKTVDAQLYTVISKTESSGQNEKAEIDVNISSASIGASTELSKTEENICKREFSSAVLQYFDIKKCLIESFLKIRDSLNVKYIYIYLDDYSEMDQEAQEIFMDWFVAPLNNVSDDFVKFKIATYPSRFYYGRLDNQKIDEINLDFYSALYAYKNITKMEELSIDYVRRLLCNRFEVFLPGKKISDYFDMKNEELFELLFDMSLNTPRTIGYILGYCFATHVTIGKKITKAALNMAAQKYFEDVTEQYFEKNRFVVQSFDEMSSLENLKFLMEKIIKKEEENDKQVNEVEKRNLPTSHFMVSNSLCSLLDSLELNGYITTYNKVNDKDNNPSTLYAMNYGMCQKSNLKFGRPKDTELRKYYSERKFLFNDLIKDHFNESQEIRCPNGHIFPFENYDAMKAYGMSCPKCSMQLHQYVECKLETTNKFILDIIRDYVDKSLKLNDGLEYEILNFLGNNREGDFIASMIAGELDCTYQLIAKRAQKLIDRELVYVSRNDGQRRYYKISQYGLKELEKRK